MQCPLETSSGFTPPVDQQECKSFCTPLTRFQLTADWSPLLVDITEAVQAGERLQPYVRDPPESGPATSSATKWLAESLGQLLPPRPKPSVPVSVGRCGGQSRQPETRSHQLSAHGTENWPISGVLIVWFSVLDPAGGQMPNRTDIASN